MKSKLLGTLMFVAGTAAFFSFKYAAAKDRSSDEKRKIVIETVMKTVNAAHFSPRDLDDTFSARVYNKCVTAFDYEKLYFTQQDIIKLKVFQYSIDDQLRNRSIEFFDSLDAIYLRRFAAAPKYYEQLLTKPFTFTSNEEIQLNPDKDEYAANEKEMVEKWRKHLKYQVLVRYVDMKKEQEKKKENKDSANVKMKTEAELEIAARDEIKNSYVRFYKRMNKRKDNDRFTFFVNALSENIDPHTNYYPPVDKSKFDESMSGSFFGIGAQLQEENDRIKIVAIITGSPSWKQGELKSGDEIQMVAQDTKEPVDIKGMDIDEVVKLIRGPKGTEVRLTVKKSDGVTKVIPIIRGVVEREETFAKSAIIKTSSGPVGYIYLPEFYADFNHTSGRTCSADVLAEVKKLKGENVTGIILDLRYNGGGSLGDVVDMAGTFIGNGPVVQVKSNHATPSVLRTQPGDSIAYKGPLAIMVNTNSASASEILAAVLQDYKRAIIVGSTTYGKGTVQKMVDLDAMLDPGTRLQLRGDTSDADPSIGSLKLTMEKFYRVSGGSTQLRGVIPDVTIPDAFDGYDDEELGERHQRSALAWDEVPAAHYRPSNSLGNLQQVVTMSKSRIDANPTFTLIKENSAFLKKKKEDNKISLNEDKYRKEQEELNAISKKLEDLQKKATPLEMANITVDLPRINLDSTSIAKNKEWLKALSKDVAIAETVNIIGDMSKSGMSVNFGTGMK